MQEITAEIAVLREKAGLSIEELAERCGKSARTIYRWERGESKPEKLVVEMLERMVQGEDHNGNYDKAFTFIDLFAGIGGMRLGFEAVGGKCVYTCEYNKHARQTYAANFPTNHPFSWDIREINLAEVPSYDVLLAGFPCQPFSIAGVSKKNAIGQPHGFECKTQGTLFFDVARFIDQHRPLAFVLENVKGLIHHDKGNTFRIIMETLQQDLGYHADYRIINAKGYLPQNRDRTFIVGFRDLDFSFDGMYVPDPESGPTLRTVLHPEDGTEEAEPPFTYGEKALVDGKYTLTAHLWEYLQEYSKKHKAKGNGFGYSLVGPEDKARTLSARYYKDGSEILVHQNGDIPRRLTPRECSRLMGFDRPDMDPFRIPVSDTQAYRQFGNAVAVPVVEEVARFILPLIKESREILLVTAGRQLRLPIERARINA